IGDRAVALPVLAARPEDLRALCLDQLSRLGLALYERPLGLDTHGLARLSEHTWPGNDAELASVLLQAALVARGEVVGTTELEAIGFVPLGRAQERASERPQKGAGPIPMTRRKRSR